MPRGKQQRGEKSAAIRELLDQNPSMPAGEVVSTLASRGLKVHTNLVYTLRAQTKSRRKGRRANAIQATNGAADPVQLVRKVKELAARAGGMKQLRELVEVMAE
jgi:hypothetical protein